MDNIIEKIREESLRVNDKFKGDKHYLELKEFQEKMEKLGVKTQNSYNLPPLDTIGKRLYQK